MWRSLPPTGDILRTSERPWLPVTEAANNYNRRTPTLSTPPSHSFHVPPPPAALPASALDRRKSPPPHLHKPPESTAYNVPSVMSALSTSMCFTPPPSFTHPPPAPPPPRPTPAQQAIIPPFYFSQTPPGAPAFSSVSPHPPALKPSVSVHSRSEHSNSSCMGTFATAGSPGTSCDATVRSDIISDVYPSANGQHHVTEWARKIGLEERMVSATPKRKHITLSDLRAAIPEAASCSSPEEAAAAASVARLVHRRRKRRAAVKQRRKMAQQRLQRKHAEIDTWRENIQAQERKRQEAKRLKQEADRVQGEVRRKISSVEEHLQSLELLRTLRDTRDMKARSSGLFTSAASDETFADVTGRLTQLLDRHLLVYEAELKTLEVIAEPDHRAEQKQGGGGGGGAQQVTAALQVLFGAERRDGKWKEAVAAELKQGDVTAHHLVHMLHWDHRPEELMKIRSSWDRYLVGADDPLGSSVPPHWVAPVEPCSAVWSSAVEGGSHQ